MLVPLLPPSVPLLIVMAWATVVLLAASSPPLSVRVFVAELLPRELVLLTSVTPPVNTQPPEKVLLAAVIDRLFARLPTVPARVRVPAPVNRPAVLAVTLML